MLIKEIWRDFIRQISRNRMRSILTVLGILVGVASLVAVSSVGDAGKSEIYGELGSFGIDRIMFYAADNTAALKSAFAEEIKEDVSGITAVVPQRFRKCTVAGHDGTYTVNAAGVTEDIVKIEKKRLISGRFIRSSDVETTRKAAVIGSALADELFGSTDLGVKRSITLNGEKLKVIGVVENTSPIYNAVVENRIYIPLSTFDELFGGYGKIDEISVISSDTADMNDVAKRCADMLLGLRNGAAIKTVNLADEMANAERIMDIFSLVLSSIACISLIVSGIGIMNIMLVTVKERKREIGVMKALGATGVYILTQFLTEAVLYSFAGALIGTCVGVGAAALICEILSLKMTFSPISAFVGALFAVLTGAAFGLFPALKASKLDPVEALKDTYM